MRAILISVETPEYKEHIGSCKACGNSPINHTAAYSMATVAIWHGYLGRFLISIPFLSRLEAALRHLLAHVDRFNYSLGILLGFIRINNDPSRAASYRSQVIWEEAARRGIRMEQLRFLGTYTEVYRALLDEEWIYFERLPIPPHSKQEGYAWLDDKVLLNRALREHGIPMPPAFSVSDEADAVRAFEECGGRVVTKPRAGSRARHTTTFIDTLDELRLGFRSAQTLCRYVYVGTHLEGGVCRGTLVGGKLAGFFQGNPPRIEGDGISSIRELIRRTNETKHERVQDIVLTDEHEAFLRRLGCTPDTVLDEGRRIDLTHRTGRLFGGETRELLQSVHPKLRNYLERAAQILDVPVVGFDLIIEDPEKDPDGQKWGIIEANSLPFIDLHYLPLHGTPSNVAAHVWDLWEKKAPAGAGFSYATSLTSFSKIPG